MRVSSLIVVLAAITFVSAAPVPLPEAEAAAVNPDWKRSPPDWKREADAVPGAPDWKRDADAEPGAPAWRRDASWGGTSHLKREADASEEKRDPRWGNIYTW
ncbi:hypothetical protein ACEPAH_263 [Sanghuangporus vaninii]